MWAKGKRTFKACMPSFKATNLFLLLILLVFSTKTQNSTCGYYTLSSFNVPLFPSSVWLCDLGIICVYSSLWEPHCLHCHCDLRHRGTRQKWVCLLITLCGLTWLSLQHFHPHCFLYFSAVEATLKFTYTEKYPDEPPLFEIYSQENLEDRDVEELLLLLEKEVCF